MVRPRKLKLHQPVYLVRLTDWWRFSFLGLQILDLEHFKVSGSLIFLYTFYMYGVWHCFDSVVHRVAYNCRAHCRHDNSLAGCSLSLAGELNTQQKGTTNCTLNKPKTYVLRALTTGPHCGYIRSSTWTHNPYQLWLWKAIFCLSYLAGTLRATWRRSHTVVVCVTKVSYP